MRVRAIAMVFGMLGTALLSGTVSAAEESPRIRADLEGRPIKASEIGSYYCHDFAFPEVHCFSTASELEAASASGDGLVAAAVGPGDYLTIYADQGFVGSYMHVSQNYDTLFWIGWNDRVSSFKARNSARGTFWSDWNGEGLATTFCCNQTVAALSATVDNTFTLTKDTANAITFENGLQISGVIGIDLSLKTGFNTSTKIKHVFSSVGQLCGSDSTWPSASRVVGK